ncbi:MAG: biopolymer transporter ExbD [Planctomycetales bacterium]|nr:biopolymer transporter ExbD [Planctomycetales bacterium]
MRRRRRKAPGDVELNLAAMLDMAFQLLAFFIFTFKPAPVEGQLLLHLPPAQAVTKVAANPNQPGGRSAAPPPAEMNALMLSVLSASSGDVGALKFGTSVLFQGPANKNSLARLDKKLKEALASPTSPFDQVTLQIGPKLRYSELMKIVDVCLKQQLPDGKPLTKISFVELPSGADL